jgi:hypothetical protein
MLIQKWRARRAVVNLISTTGVSLGFSSSDDPDFDLILAT